MSEMQKAISTVRLMSKFKWFLPIFGFLCLLFLPLFVFGGMDSTTPPYDETSYNVFKEVAQEESIPFISLMVYAFFKEEEDLSKANLKELAKKFKYTETETTKKIICPPEYDLEEKVPCTEHVDTKTVEKVYSLKQLLEKEGYSKEDIEGGLALQQVWSIKLGAASGIYEEGDIILGDNDWMWPTISTTITSGFGYREAPCSGCTSYHEAVDIGAVNPGVDGDPVWSMDDGTVISAMYTSWGGYSVFIDHGNGIQSRYIHLMGYVVEPGQKVKKGQLVGFMGNTGDSTGTHLDFQIKIYGRPVDPLLFFNL